MVKNTRSKRVAKFSLPISLVESGEAGKLLAFIEFTPIRVECLNYANRYDFVGLSPIFKEVDEHLMWPTITLNVDKNEETGQIFSVTVAD